ncbi:hypothetical protein AEV23_00063 [Klebsiella phage VB_KpM-AEV23]|nr:hypothetical protein AEV23_00063 [Klebsiella phage VB_KpM-AEV23]
MTVPTCGLHMELVTLTPYPPQLAVVLSKKQHDELIKEMDLPPFGHWEDEYPVAATTFTFNRKSYPYCFIVVELYLPDDLRYNTISHEGIHVMSSLMKYVGLKYDTDNDEWYAYQHDFIVNAICKAHDEYIKAKKEQEIAPKRIETGNHPSLDDTPPWPEHDPMKALLSEPSSQDFLND